jgi:hypothetical protein
MTDFVDEKPPTSFWVFSGAALVWNLIGLVFYYGQVSMAPETASSLTAAQQEFFASTPTWATASHAIAVTAGVLGSLLLLFRKTWATPVFVLSLLGVLAQDLHAFVLSDALEVFGGANALVLPAIVLVVAGALVWYSASAKGKGWLS